MFRPSQWYIMWSGTTHPEDRSRRYHFDSGQRWRWNDDIPRPIWDRNRYSRCRTALQSYAEWLRIIVTGTEKPCSAVLGTTSHIYARAIPWRLAEGCVSSIQSRYIYIYSRDTVTMTHEHLTGPRACLGRRYELSYCSRKQNAHKMYSGSSRLKA